MRPIPSTSLFIGHSGDCRDPLRVRAAGVFAVVDLAINEAPPVHSYETTVLRFPLFDGEGNQPWLLQAAIAGVAQFVMTNVPTLVACSQGLSRSPSIAAAGISLARNLPIDQCLKITTERGPADVSPYLWNDVVAATTAMRAR